VIKFHSDISSLDATGLHELSEEDKSNLIEFANRVGLSLSPVKVQIVELVNVY